MHISGGSGHFYMSRDPPPPYTANTTYTTKQPRQISVSCVKWSYTEWSLVWKTWKCRWIWRLSGKCLGIDAKSGNCQGNWSQSRYKSACVFWRTTILISLHFSLSWVADEEDHGHLCVVADITLTIVATENARHESTGQSKCETWICGTSMHGWKMRDQWVWKAKVWKSVSK